MKKMWKRFVSLLLACTLLAGMLPLSASAAVSAPGEGSEQYKYAESILNKLNESITNEQEKYGLYGPALLADSELYTYSLQRSIYDKDSGKWTTDTQYILVPGVDAQNTTTPNYNGLNSGQPWAESNPSAIYIAEGVTGIGNYAFASQPSLNSVVFQDASDLTYIGQRAFYEDDNAVFTDEGNGDGTTLDLSGVTTMGEYAFYNCDKLTGVELGGNITAVETVEGKVKETEHKIPNNAFNNSGLQTVTIPDGIQHIGDGAFGHTSLSKVEDLVLPDGLKTIGDNAFVVTMGSGETGIGITSLTIPSSVNSIGANAFSGRRNLAEVTVEDDNVPNTQLTLGNAAFGFNESSAFSEWGSITDDRTGQKYEGTMGTKFYLPADLTEKFINGTNCYTGDIEPMKWVKTQQPTCDTDGYHLYETTKKGAYDDEGKPLVLQYKYTIPMLGHDWDEGNLVTVAATCETPSYKYEPCTRGCGEINIIDDHVADALSHNYQVNENGGVMNPGIKKSNNTPTTVTYTCQNYKDGDGNLHDGDLDASYTWTIPATTLSATTSDTLADLQLPSVTGSTQASLAWADSVTTTEKLTEGTSNYQVKLVVSNDANFKPYTNADFTIEVKVEKTKLDFSEVYFENSTRWINGNTPAFSVEGMPEGTSEVKIEYKKKNEENAPWTTEKPKEEAVGDAGDYLVRYTFSYDPAIYDLVTNDPELSPPDDYTLEKAKDKDGEGTITGDYRVAQMTMESVKVSAINNLVFNGTHENIDGEAQPTVQLEGVLLDSKVTFTWTEDEKQVTETIDPTEAANFSGAKITNAGTYKVAVKIEKENYVTVDREVFVTIAKQPLTAPRAESNLRYDTTEKTGVPDSTDNRYTVSGNKQTNAGTYKAEAKVVNSKNYQWPEAADPDGDGTAEISWQILHRLTAKPTIPIGQYSYEEGIYRTPVTTTSNDIVFEYKDDKLVAKYKGETAYTATDAKETNAGSYKVTVHLENNNYKWAGDQSTTDLTLSWRITPLQIAAPTIAAADATYDGAAYAGKVSLTHSKAQGSNESSENIIDLEKTKISYYADKTGGEPMAPPVNVGTYYAGVEEWTFVKGELAQNYNVLGGQRGEFKITQKQATMEFTNKAVTATYTAEGTGLQQVTVDGLVDADKDNMATVLGDVKYTYKYSTEPNTNWDEMEEAQEATTATKFTDVGYYQITAKWGTGTVSNNYTAADATYTLTIKKAEDQSITLTPDEQGTWTATEGQTPNYTITYGEAATFKVTGTAELDEPVISYEVKGELDVVSVDSGSGMVTIKQAGEATITVTAAETANVGAASVEYTVTVKKAKPTVNTGLEGDKLTVAYTGNPIEGYDEAEATATVVDEAEQPTGPITYTFYTDAGCSDENKVTNGGGAESNIPIAVGTYYMKLTYDGDTNYESAELKGVPVTVTKARLTVDAEGYAATYDGKDHPAITVDSVKGNSEEITGYTVKYAVTNNDTAPNENAGEEVWKGTLPVKDVADSTSENLYYWYMVTADNYNPAIGEVEVKIAPAPLTVAGEPTHYTKEYDGDKTVDETFDEITVTAKDVPEVTIDVDATGTYDNENAGEGKNVTLTLTLSGTDGTEIDWDNYSYNGAAPTDGKITLTKDDAGTITPKAITVTGISAENRVYDGTEVVQLMGEPETTDKVGSDDLTLTLTSNATGSIESADVGNDKAVTVATSVITLGGTDANNYKVSAVKDAANGDVKVNITQRPVNLEFAGIGQDDRIIEKAYTGQPVNVTVGPVNDSQPNTGFVKGDTLNAGDVVYTYSPEGHTAVGSYTVTAALKENPTGNYDNYQLNFPEKATLKITPAEMVVTAKNYTGTYTGKAHDVTASWTAKTTAGDQPITITGVQFIKKDEQHNTKPEADAEGWSEILFINVAQSGEYWYKVTAENYAPIVGDSAVTITINPATLTLSSDLTEEKEYDGTTEAEVTGETVTGAQNGESITVSSVSAAYDNANVGTGKTITTTYEVTFGAGVTPGNYTYTGNVEGKATSTWTIKTTVEDGKITQAPVTVTISDQTSVYDGEKPTVGQEEGTKEDPKAWYVSTGEVFSQDTTKDNLGITLSIASDSDAKDADTYAITGKWTNKNYAVTFAGSWKGEEHNGTAGTYTIDHRPISVQIGDAEGFYGDAPVLDNVTLDDVTEDGESNAGLVEGESLKEVLTGLELATAANAQSDISDDDITYPIYAKKGGAPVQAPTQLGNYKVTFTNEGTYTVKPRPITITISDAESDYGCDLAQLTYSKTLSEAYTGTNKGVVFVGDDETDLKIALFTTAKKGSDAGTYSISGKVSDGDVSENYSITWAGETSWNGSDQDSTTADSAKGTYTIDKAQLKVSVKRSDIYAQYGEEISNPVTFTNASTGQEIASDASDYTALSQAITYEMNPSDGLTQVEGSQKAEGKFTVAVTQQMVTVTVNVAATENYEAATAITYRVHASASGSLDVSLPFADLTYNGQTQQLLAQAPELPNGVYIHYKVGESGEWTAYSDKNQDNWKEVVGENAGSYTVYWETTSSGNYNASSGNSNTSIAKANLEGTFEYPTYPHVLATGGNSYDSAQVNPLDLSANPNYTGKADAYTYRSNDTGVAIAVNGGSTIRVLGSAGDTADITVTVPGDNNYNEGTFTYRLEISDDLSKIVYSVGDQEVTYNGQPQTIAVNVTAPASGATVMYQDEDGNYTLSEPPAYTDVKEGGYPIKFQITAPGYKTEEGTATLTIEPKDIKECQVEGIAESYTFVNKPIEPQTVEVVDGSVILKEDTDYTITYGANTEVGEDKGSVIIKGTGNYTGSMTKNFEITPVDASDLTASLNRTFGYYGDGNTNNGTVTVTHGSHTVTSDGSNTVSIAVKDNTGTDVTNQSDVVSINDHQTVTFNQVGTYTIEVTVTGNHETNAPIQLTYALLPVEEGKLVLKADNETSVVETYGDTVNGTITVTDVNGTPMTENTDYTLAYTYTPFEGTAQGSKPYDPSVMSGTPAAGMYVVTATGQGGYANSVGTFTFLILQRDLAKATLAVNDTDLVFNHDEKKPDVTVTVDGNAQPTKDTDYTITYYNNVNASNAAKAVVTATGNNFTGSKTADFTIAPKPITGCVVENIPDQYYTGNEVIPPVTIKDSSYTLSYTLILGYDYTTACADKGPGEATVTITGTGNYRDQVEKTFTIKSEGAPEPSERFDLVVTPSQWTWGDDLTNLDLSVTFGTDKELTLGTEYTLEVNGQTFDGTTGKTKDDALTYIKGLKPDEYTITATGMDAYAGSTDTETVTIQKIQPTVTVKATPNSLSGGGKVTLTLKGEKLPNGTDLKTRLSVTAKNDNDVTLEDLHIQWPEDGSLTAELTLPNTNETYTFALRFAGDEYYEPASSDAMVVVGQQTSGGGGGSDPGDQPADPDDTGVSDWLNTKDHLAYLAGYPGGTFGPDQNMTRAEAAQMFYNLLLEKDVKITVEFEDVPADAWYAKPVNTLASLGILSGVGNGRFDPERSITRAEFTVIAMKFANTSGGGVNIFSDVNEDDWFYSAVVDSTQYGWINGYPDGTFRPEATISRAEVTVIVNHMLGRAADRPYVIAHEEELNTFGDVNRGHWGYFHVAEATNAHEYHTEDGTESWTGLS